MVSVTQSRSGRRFFINSFRCLQIAQVSNSWLLEPFFTSPRPLGSGLSTVLTPTCMMSEHAAGSHVTGRLTCLADSLAWQTHLPDATAENTGMEEHFREACYSLCWLSKVNCLFLSFPQVEYNCELVKVDWLAASIALRVVGAVLFIFLRHWRKICMILQPMGSKGRYLKKCHKACWPTKSKETWTKYTTTTLLSQRKLALTARNTLFAL